MRFLYTISVTYIFFQALSTCCIKGVSADDDPEVKPKEADQDGMDFLSEWSLWSRCSRSCGTGVQFRGRRCNRDRSPCLRFPRQHRTCNNQLCPVNSRDFRDVQCAREDDREVLFQGNKAKWKSIYRGTTKCMLFCHPVGHRVSFYLGRVIDGTKCIDEPYSVCVAGKCTSVGCDRVIGSQKIFDRCKVCGGNGSTCEPYSGMIDREPTAEEKKEGYLKLFVIPEGATTILISEVSQNYLAIRRASGEFVFGGDKKMAHPGTYRINTTDFQYSKLPSENSEAVMIMGPTMEEFYVMAILTNKDNPKADYEYWLPKNRPTTPPKPVFKKHTQSSSAKTRVTSKASPRKTILDDSNFLKGRKTNSVFPSSEYALPHTQPMTTPGELAESSPSTPEQHMSTEYPTTTASSHSTTTPGDVAESSPSTPEQHISTEYPTTTASSHSTTTPGDVAESSPSTPEQHMSTEYSTTTASSHSTATPGDVAESSPSTSEQHISTEYSTTTASSHYTATPGDVAESSPSTPEQHISTEYSTTTASSHSTTTPGDVAESSPSTPEQHMSTEHSGTTASTPSSHPTTTAGSSGESTPTTLEQHISTEFSTTSTGVDLNGHHQNSLSQTSTSPSGQPITTKLNRRTTTTGQPLTTQEDDTTNTTEHPTATQDATAANLTTSTEKPTEMLEHFSTPKQKKSVTDSSSSTITSTEPPVATRQPSTIDLPVSDNHSSSRFPSSPRTMSTMESPTTTPVPTTNTTSTTQKRTTIQASRLATQNAVITEGIIGTYGESEPTREPPITEIKPNTSELNVNDTSMNTSTSDGNSTKDVKTTKVPSVQRTSTVQPTNTKGVTETVSSEYPDKTGNSTPGSSVNSSKISGKVEGQLRKVENRTVMNDNTTEYSTVQPTPTADYQNVTITPTATTEKQNLTVQTSATEIQNKTQLTPTVDNQNVTIQPIATEIQNTTTQPTPTTEKQNVTIQPIATEIQNTTTQPTPTTENQNVTIQPIATEIQNTTTQPTPTAENQNVTIQPIATEIQNTTTQPTPTTEKQNVTVQSIATEIQNATTQPTPTTEKQNVTIQPIATEIQNTTTQPTPTAENQNVTIQPIATEIQNATTQPTPTTEKQNVTIQPIATEIQNATTQPTPTAENQNVTIQPIATEIQNATTHPTPTVDNQNVTVPPIATEIQNTTTQPTPTTENQNVTVQPIATEIQNATTQPTPTVDNQNVTVQPIATEIQNATTHPTPTVDNQNVTVQPIATEIQNATTHPTPTVDNQNVTIQPIATEIQNTTTQPTPTTENQNVTVQPIATEIQNATTQPTPTVDNQNVTVQPIATEIQNATTHPTPTVDNQNVTVQPIATEIQNATTHPTPTVDNQNVTVQPIATEIQNTTAQPTPTVDNQNVTVQPIATDIQNTTQPTPKEENQNVTLLPPTTSGTLHPSATENKFATEQPTTIHHFSITENQNTSVQPTADKNKNITLQPITTTEGENGTLQPITTEALQSTAKKNLNATTQPTPTGTVPPAATKAPNTSAHPVTTAHVTATMLTTTKSLNITFVKISAENSTATYYNFTEESNTTVEQNNAAITAGNLANATLVDATTTERPTTTTTTEQTADKQFIDSENYSSTGQSTIKESLTTEPWNMTNGTVWLITGRETNSTVSTTLEGTDRTGNQTSEFLPWSEWTPCSRTCGLGFKVRARLCRQNNKSICPRNETQVVLCTIRQCEKLVPTWTPWRPWTACSSQCGVGLRIRVRSCLHSKIMTSLKSSCPGPRYQIGICRSSAKCSTKVDVVKPSAVSLTDTLETKTVPEVTLPVTTKISSFTMEGFSSEKRKDNERVTRVVASSSSAEGFIRIASSVSAETSFTEPSAALPTSAAAETAAAATLRKSSPSASLLAKPSSSAARLLLQPSPSSSSSFSSTSSIVPSSSSIMLQPVPCVSCANGASRASSAHPSPTRITSLGPSLSTTVKQTPKLSTSSSSSMADTAKTSSHPKTSASRSLGGNLEFGTVSKFHASDVSSIEPSRTSSPLQQSSAGIVRVQSGSCPRCRTSRKKQKLFCTGDYAIRVQVKNDTLTSNDKTVYHLLVQDIYKSTLPLAKELFIRVTGIQCPCPLLETGKEYLIVGRARRTKKGYSKVLINRRSFVEEWSGRVDADVAVLRNRCLALEFDIASSYLKSVDLKPGIGGENNSGATQSPSVIPKTGKPTTTRSTTTSVINKYSECPPCVLLANSSIGSLYCTSEYAIRARVTKYRRATNRTMFYAHLTTTYKTPNELPFEVLIRVPGEKCPCPRLAPDVEYLMIGKTKNTLTGKSRLTLNVQSFYAEWKDEFEKEIAATRARCGLPVMTSRLHDKTTTVAPDQSTTTLAPTETPTRSTTRHDDTSCPPCDQSTVLDNQQKRFCKNENVFRGLVAESFSTPTNRTLYYITMVTSFKTNFEMPDKILARLSDNNCQCSHLMVGKEYLIMGQVKMNKKGKARVVLTKKSFIQYWNSGFIEKIDQLRTKCELPVVNNGNGPSTEPSGTPQEITTTPRKAVQPTTTVEVMKIGTCRPCRASANVHDFCSNDYVFRGRVLKGYRTSAYRTVYHVSVTTSYKSSANLSSVVLVRVPDASCPCPQLQVGVDYVIMGWVRVKGKSVSRMTLLPKNFVQKWDEGFEEELSSIQSSCKKSSIIDGPLVQSVAVEKAKTLPASSVTLKPSTNIKTMTIATRTSTQAPPPIPSLALTRATETRCALCQTSKKRNRLYCTSDYVLTVEIEKKEHNPVAHNTKYYAVVKYTFKQRDPLEVMIVLWVLNNWCNCPDLKLDHTYVVMVNSDFGENGVERLVMSERSFIKEWTTGLQRRILKLKNTCHTDHRRKY